jgi:hypothetical protein
MKAQIVPEAVPGTRRVVETVVWLDATVNGPEVKDAKSRIHDKLIGAAAAGVVDTKHYIVHLTSVAGGAHMRLVPKDPEERETHPSYDAFVPLIDVLSAVAEQCRHRYFEEKHAPGGPENVWDEFLERAET